MNRVKITARKREAQQHGYVCFTEQELEEAELSYLGEKPNRLPREELRFKRLKRQHAEKSRIAFSARRTLGLPVR